MRELIIGTTFSKKPEIINDNELHSDSNDSFINITMLQLYNIFNVLMSNYNKKMNTETVIQRQISIDQFKIEDMMVKIKEAILNVSKLNFAEIIKDCESKIEVVVTFLAVLELIKQRNVRVYQEHNFSDIYLEGIEENEENRY
jgi:segregation and condensation protein A